MLWMRSAATTGSTYPAPRILAVPALLSGPAEVSAKGRALGKLATNLENAVAEGLVAVERAAERVLVKESLVRRAGEVACAMLDAMVSGKRARREDTPLRCLPHDAALP